MKWPESEKLQHDDMWLRAPESTQPTPSPSPELVAPPPAGCEPYILVVILPHVCTLPALVSPAGHDTNVTDHPVQPQLLLHTGLLCAACLGTRPSPPVRLQCSPLLLWYTHMATTCLPARDGDGRSDRPIPTLTARSPGMNAAWESWNAASHAGRGIQTAGLWGVPRGSE